MPLRASRVPVDLRYPLPAAAEWGLGDDIEREMKVDAADVDTLEALVALVASAPDELWSWLIGSESPSPAPSSGYVAITCLTMAADSARVRLSRS